MDGDDDGKACEELPCPCESSGGGGGGANGGQGRGAVKQARVSDIADGDTVEVRLGSRTKDVRLVGIDTPEVYFGAECGGSEASSSMKRMLDVGDRVRLVRDRSQDNRDRYGRLLRYVEHGGRDLGRRQVRKGWAKVYVYGSRFNRVNSYRRAQRRARDEGSGVWGRCGGDFHQPK